MGAWGTGSFENDTALDWCYNLEDSSDTKILWDAIEAVLQEEYLDADIAVEALAALEVAAGLKGRKGKEIPQEVEKWLEENSALRLPDNFYIRADLVLNRIIGSESELNELWEESDSYQEWKKTVSELQSRITS